MPERIVVVGYGPVGARFVDELLPTVRAGLAELTVIGAEDADAYNRVLVAEYAVGAAERASLEITDAAEARDAGVRILTGTTVVEIRRSRRTVLLGTGEQVLWDRLVLATGARAQLPTLDGTRRLRRDALRPPPDGAVLDSAEAPLPAGVTMLRDLADAERVAGALASGARLVVLGAGVLGMELALAAVRAGSAATVVFHGSAPMERNLDRGAGTVLARAARRGGVELVAHARAEGILFRTGDDGASRFGGLVCADGKQVPGDLLVISCGVGARTELAGIAGLPVGRGVLVDAGLRSWGDPDVFAIGDCAHVAEPPASAAAAAGASSEMRGSPVAGGPSGLIGAGWRQAEWLAACFAAEFAAGSAGRVGPAVSAGSAGRVGPAAGAAPAPLAEELPGIVMLKADDVDVAAAGDVLAEPWDDEPAHAEAGGGGIRSVAQWADPEHGRYVKMVTRDGVLEGFVSVGMPRAAAELTLLFQRRSELPADRSVLLRLDGPDHVEGAGDPFAPDATICWCNGVTAGAIGSAAHAAHARAEEASVACIGRDTRAGTGCGTCRGRIAELLTRLGGAPGEAVGAGSTAATEVPSAAATPATVP